MAHHVYANNNEIASKTAKGKSNAEMPNVCFTTPPPVGGGTPVPFANTCDAKDLTKVSKSVLIQGGGIALENKSFFKKSTGDEASNFKKGIITGQKNGKGFFQSWSPNVKVEGKGVARHEDLVTHNHSNPPNALPNRYKSIFSNDPDCAKDKARIKKNCKPKKTAQKKDEKKNNRGIRRHITNVTSGMDEIGQTIYGYDSDAVKSKDPNVWMKDHCQGMWVKPSILNSKRDKDAFTDLIESKRKDFENLGTALNYTLKNKSKIVESGFADLLRQANKALGPDATKQILKDKFAKDALLAAIPVKGGGLIKTLGLVAKGGISSASYISFGQEVAKALGTDGVKELIDDMKFIVKDAEDQFKNVLKEWKENPDSAMSELMSVNAKLNKCLKARKCELVSYESSKKDNVKKGEGCCPGQTGHHVIPDAAVKDAKCKDYKYKDAPTICLEGQNNTHGSHGRAHQSLKKSMIKYNGADEPAQPIPFNDMREASLDSIEEVTKHCNRDCLRKQLDSFYNDCTETVAHPGTRFPGDQKDLQTDIDISTDAGNR